MSDMPTDEDHQHDEPRTEQSLLEDEAEPHHARQEVEEKHGQHGAHEDHDHGDHGDMHEGHEQMFRRRFFGEHAVYVEGFAQDGYCSNTMRSLTDKEVIKHVGDVRNFRTWWEELLAQVELVADDLFEFIWDAQDIELDFSELPFTVTEFYNLLGFPDYLAERAAGDAEANAASPFEIDMWTLHRGAQFGEFWTADGWDDSGRDADHVTVRKTVRHSLARVREFWIANGIWPETTPQDDELGIEYEGPRPADLEQAACTECGTNVWRTRRGPYIAEYDTGAICGYCSYECYFSHRHRNNLEEIAGEQSVYHPPA